MLGISTSKWYIHEEINQSINQSINQCRKRGAQTEQREASECRRLPPREKRNEACTTVGPDVKGGREHGLVYV